MNADDFDPGESVLEKEKTKPSNKADTSSTEETKSGPKATIPGAYDDVHQYNAGSQTSAVNPDKSLSKDMYECSKQRAIFAGSIIGIGVVGAIVLGVIFAHQGRYCF